MIDLKGKTCPYCGVGQGVAYPNEFACGYSPGDNRPSACYRREISRIKAAGEKLAEAVAELVDTLDMVDPGVYSDGKDVCRAALAEWKEARDE